MKKILDQTIYKWFNKFISGRHSLLWVYVLVLIFLALGVYFDSGFRFISYLILYSVVLISFYFMFEYFFRKNNSIQSVVKIFISKMELPDKSNFPLLLFIGSALFVIAHFLYLGEIPTLSALMSNDSFKIYCIRKDVTENSSTIINYISSFLLKAIIPFLLLYFYQKRNWKIFIPVLIISFFYSISLVAKSYVVTSFIPLLIFSFSQKHFWRLIGFAIIIFAGLNFLMFVANPSLRSGDVNQRIVQEHVSDKGVGLEKSMSNLADRTLFIPGKTVSGWFRAIPEYKPFLYGGGYRFLAPIIGQEYHEYSNELYPFMYPEYSKLGYAGAVNVASFMYDFANFGWIGLVYSAILLAFIFSFINPLFAGFDLIKFCLNIFYVLMLSSSSLFTLLFSGGWALIILLFLIMKRNFESEKIEIDE